MFVIQLFFRCKVIIKLAYNERIEKELYERINDSVDTTGKMLLCQQRNPFLDDNSGCF